MSEVINLHETELYVAEIGSIEPFKDFLEYAGITVLQIIELKPEDGQPEEIIFNGRLMPIEYAYLKLDVHKNKVKKLLKNSLLYKHYAEEL